MSATGKTAPHEAPDARAKRGASAPRAKLDASAAREALSLRIRQGFRRADLRNGGEGSVAEGGLKGGLKGGRSGGGLAIREKDGPGHPYGNLVRGIAFALFEAGYGYKSVASLLGLPRSTVRDWGRLYRSFGLEARERRRTRTQYPLEVRLAAARDVVERGMSIQEAAIRNDVRAPGAVSKWARAYRTGGERAVREMRRSGRPKGSGGPKEQGMLDGLVDSDMSDEHAPSDSPAFWSPSQPCPSREEDYVGYFEALLKKEGRSL